MFASVTEVVKALDFLVSAAVNGLPLRTGSLAGRQETLPANG